MQKKQLFATLLLLLPFFLFSQINPNNVTIVRDSFGVPHIYGHTDVETIYGFAWAQAEDDFETIQHRICLGRGMMGKLLGKKGAKMDYVHYLMRVEDFVDNNYEKLISAEGKAHLQAFAQGLNDYAAKNPKEVLLKGLFPIKPQDLEKGYCMTYCFMLGLDKQLKRVYGGFWIITPILQRKKKVSPY